MVFGLRQHLVDGVNVNAFLSKNLRNAAGWDGLFWHYGMHHFHLGRGTGKDGFVKRSKHLLFRHRCPYGCVLRRRQAAPRRKMASAG